MFHKKESSFGKVTLAFLVGAAAGAAAALLLAPMPGKKLQRQIRNKWEDGKENFEELAGNFETVVAGVQDAAKNVQAAAKKFAMK